jgi:hypothetical protein
MVIDWVGNKDIFSIVAEIFYYIAVELAIAKKIIEKHNGIITGPEAKEEECRVSPDSSRKAAVIKES